jgi:ABC-type multidrug transport system ATPase subunit
MDVQARRLVWDVLKKKKENRVIVLTTHYMEEVIVFGLSISHN